MTPIVVQVPEHSASSYDIIAGCDAAATLPSVIAQFSPSRVLVVIDGNVARCTPSLGTLSYPKLILEEHGEDQKTATVLGKVWERMLEEKMDRASILVAIGGGTTCDLAGFAASTYMRGIRCINVPTTLLSQVDSSIGGKTGINLGKVKNIVGAFAPPASVVLDFTFLKTLPTPEFASGTAEVIKHGAIFSASLWKKLRQSPLEQSDLQNLRVIIEESLNVKRQVVESDPLEKGLRKILNYGHTVGHAYEAWSHEVGSPLLHGEAVAIGMVVETAIGKKLGTLTEDYEEQLKSVLVAHRLPVTPPTADENRLLALMAADKKNRGNKILMAIPPCIGRCQFDVEVPTEIITDVLRER